LLPVVEVLVVDKVVVVVVEDTELPPAYLLLQEQLILLQLVLEVLEVQDQERTEQMEEILFLAR